MTFLRVVLPILLFLLLTPFLPIWDLAVSSAVYHSGSHAGFYNNSFFAFIERFGEWPAYIFCAITGVRFLRSYVAPRLKWFRQGAVAIGLSMIISCGIVVPLLKHFWHRPRPQQVVEFGGAYAFRPYYQPATGEKPLQSFPSGHAIAGFYFFILYFVGRRYHNARYAHVGLCTALLWGSFLSAIRILQGAHFLSDVLFSMLLMWEIALFADWIAFDTQRVRRLLE